MFKQLIQAKNVVLIGLFILLTGLMLLSFSNESNSAGKIKMVDIKGSLVTAFQFTGAPPVETVDITGVGNISHIGRVFYHGNVKIDVQQGIAYDGHATFNAANGDQFITTYSGPSSEQNGIATGDLTHIITPGSGTGRFEGISGSFVASIWNNRNTGTGYQNLQGEISFK